MLALASSGLKRLFAVVDKSIEYCSSENFHPACSKNEVIVVTSATYGRMHEGRCLELKMAAKHDPQYFGCSVDVLEFMDGKCSGKTECDVRVYDQQLERMSNCYEDLEKYLEASHTCISGDWKFHVSYCASLCDVTLKNRKKLLTDIQSTQLSICQGL